MPNWTDENSNCQFKVDGIPCHESLKGCPVHRKKTPATPMYTITAFYETGDSFHREDTETTLEIQWSDLEKAKKALQRIKEHYNWYKDQHGYRSRWDNSPEVPEPEWHDGIEYDFCIKLELDNGNEVQIHAPWCGYFETLYSAKIVTVGPDENDMEITFS